jgi:predicted amidohydrolase YtcJ
MTKHLLLLTLLFLSFTSCNNDTKPIADVIYSNGNIWTVNEKQPKVSAVAVKDGKIIGLGSSEAVEQFKSDQTKIINLNGKFMMPGFIEGHGHFLGFGNSLLKLNFLDSKSWDEIVQMVAKAAQELPEGTWIEGRGWHQEKWSEGLLVNNVLGYPFHDELSALTPNHPVILRHASGHALFANKAAMDVAGVTSETVSPLGGEIVRDPNGRAIGVFEERAMGIISNAFQNYKAGFSKEELKEEWLRAIEQAELGCLESGVTSFQDAGTYFYDMEGYVERAKAGDMRVRLYSMLRHSAAEMTPILNDYPIVGLGNDFFTCRAIKTEVDGALGAFGAWLLQPYNDKDGFHGQNTTSIDEVRAIAALAEKHDMQLCVHAIGDRANKEVLNIMENSFGESSGKAFRWRIEHAQHLDTADIPRFRDMGIIASMQGIHCTSDAPFVESRLGQTRAKYGAYPWRTLLDNGVVIANGTDVPVEKIDPIACFYASVTRKRSDNGFEFYPEQRMSRAEAIYSYTLGNAFAAFEEDIKGSIEEGKYADFVVLSKDLVECKDDEILDTQVLQTIINGQVVYSKG